MEEVFLNSEDADESAVQGVVGAPACGDVMKLQIKVIPRTLPHLIIHLIIHTPLLSIDLSGGGWDRGRRQVQDVRMRLGHRLELGNLNLPPRCLKSLTCPLSARNRMGDWQDLGGGTPALYFHSPHLVFAITSTSYGLQVLNITNQDIASYLKLPPVKRHCSMLAEDAIRAAVKDFQGKTAQASN